MLREIQPTLGPGAQGPDVGNLQEALIALGDSGYFRSSDPPIPYEPTPPPGGPTLQPTPDQLSQYLNVLSDRRRFQTYDSATETVVAWFQAQAVLTDPPGVVEAAPAKRLNIELRERRLFPEGYQHGIVGQVNAFLLTPAIASPFPWPTPPPMPLAPTPASSCRERCASPLVTSFWMAPYANLAGAEAWAAFPFKTNLAGRLVFQLGSWLGEFYD